jgi:hypothetical protein
MICDYTLDLMVLSVTGYARELGHVPLAERREGRGDLDQPAVSEWRRARRGNDCPGRTLRGNRPQCVLATRKLPMVTSIPDLLKTWRRHYFAE